jgi:general nucleoside transport system permease protein
MTALQHRSRAVPGWKTPVVLAVFALAAALLAVLAPDGTTTFRFSADSDVVRLPEVGLDTVQTLWIVATLLGLVAVYSIGRKLAGFSTPGYVLVGYGVLVVFQFLLWAAAGATLPVTGLLVGSLALSTPLIFGSLAGVISERVGVINVAIEGHFLAGAFTSATVATMTGSPMAGLVAAAVAGILASLVFSLFAVRYLVDQVIVGIVLNVLVSGLTGFLYSQLLAPNASALNSPPRLPRFAIPILSDIPVLGPLLFRQTAIVYVMYVAIALIVFGLFRTRWGLRLRAVGEHPEAADTVGIKVMRTRVRNLALGGVVAGMGGAFFTIGSVGAFGKDMTAGAGFIALAAVIFGRWHPVRAALAALLFGFASNLQNTLSVIGSPVPSEFLLMLPYVITILAVAGFVGRVQGPAAAGEPYGES